MIRIQAKRKKGIRRAGMFHPAEPVEHPDNKFTRAQIKALEDEPLLVVEKIADSGIIAETGPVENMTVPQLKALLDKLGIEYSVSAKKADLVALVNDNTGEPPKE